FSFDPGEIEVPTGAKVNFIMTSKDVVHSIQVVDTNINAMVLQGHVQKISHTFNEPGEYLGICNEDTGVGHQMMDMTITVNQWEEERKMEAVLHSYKDKADKNLKKYLGTNEKDAKLSLTFFTVSFAVLLVGGLLGLVQGLERAGLLTLPNWFNYYQVL